MVTLILGAAFLPLALLVARPLFLRFKPPKHAPLLFLGGGIAMLLLGLAGGYALRVNIQSGVVHFTSRRIGEIYANASQQPLEYWAAILALYSLAIFLAALGLAAIGLCFRKANSQ